MFDREVFAGHFAPLFLVAAVAVLPGAASALIASIVFGWRRSWKRAGALALAVPLITFLSFTLLEVGCVAQVVVVDVSSPQNAFRARTLVRDAGMTTSWSLVVEVGRRGWFAWQWEPVFRTYQDIPAEVVWRDATTLVIRSHRSQYARPLTTRVDRVSIVFEECPAAPAKPPWDGPYVNRC